MTKDNDATLCFMASDDALHPISYPSSTLDHKNINEGFRKERNDKSPQKQIKTVIYYIIFVFSGQLLDFWEYSVRRE
jgi:hypothetical protein